MNHARRAVEDWRKLKTTMRGSVRPSLLELSPCSVLLESVMLADSAEVERIAQGFGARCGWLERQSRIALARPGEDWPGPEGGFDAILSGELSRDDVSLRIRSISDGWRLCWISDKIAENGEHLCNEQTLAGVDRIPATGQTFGARLNYRVYWRYEEDFGWRQFAARLLSFG